MRRSRITITLDTQVLKKVDRLIDKNKIRNRSHSIEYILNKYTESNVHTAVILAGGRGTKLRPYTYEIPKPLLPVKGAPILEHLIVQLKKHNVTQIIIAISYLGEKIKTYFGDGSKWGVHIEYSEEEESLNTGGAVRKIKNKLNNETFLVIHGDILTNFAFTTDIFNYFPKEKRFALESVIQKLVEQKKVSGFVFEGKWYDVGDPQNYEQAIKDYMP